MCYYIKTLYFNDPLFKETDATYILHLEGNGRYQQIEEQLKLYHPTKIVHILFNKGYKKCEKRGINTPPVDLVDAYKYAMNHATRYNTILILEDDFFFHKNIKQHTQNIDDFVKTHDYFIYRIGCIPFIQIPYNTHNYVGLCGGAHSIFYSKKMRDTIIKDINGVKDTNGLKNIDDWDIHMSFKSINYIYYTPVCYQLCGPTENQKHWGIHNPLLFLLGNIYFFILQLLRLDTQPEPGYSILYAVSKIWLLIIILFLLNKYRHVFFKVR